VKSISGRSSATPARLLPSLLTRAAFLCGTWWVLAGGRSDSWGVGAVSILLALFLSLWLAPPSRYGFSLLGLLGFARFFLYQSVKGGTQVAMIALRPRLDLRPDMLELPIRLPEGAAQVVLVCTLGLLPGTLVMEAEDNCLRLHVLDRCLQAEPELRAAEYWIARMLKLELP
jgi:multicomponent Na+:H+ antiporter subunit E